MPKGGKVPTNRQPDLATHIEDDNNDHATAAQTTSQSDLTCNRKLRMLKREQLKDDDNEQLRKLNLLEDDMPDQMKSDMLNAVAASKKSAEAEDMKRNSMIALESDEMSVIVSSSSDILSNGSQDLIDGTIFGSPSTKAGIRLPITDENGPEKFPGLEDEVPEHKSLLMVKTLFAPDGVDPDEYAKVIMAELTRHHERLNATQRQSLNLLEWGSPIIGSAFVAGAGAPIVEQMDKFDAVATQKPPFRWLSAKSSTAAVKNYELSNLDDDEIVEIYSPTSDESSQEEFCPVKKPKQAKKAVKQLAPKNVNLLPKGIQKRTGVGAAVSDAVKKKNLSLKRKGVVGKDDKAKVKQTKSEDMFAFTEEESSGEEATAAAASFKGFPRKATQGQGSQDDEVACPMCRQWFRKDDVEQHAFDCDGGVQGESDFAAPQTSKIIDFAHSRNCYVCGENFPSNVIDNHIAVCTLQEKSKQSNGLTATVASPLGTKPAQFYGTNRASPPDNSFITLRHKRSGLR